MMRVRHNSAELAETSSNRRQSGAFCIMGVSIKEDERDRQFIAVRENRDFSR